MIGGVRPPDVHSCPHHLPCQQEHHGVVTILPNIKLHSHMCTHPSIFPHLPPPRQINTTTHPTPQHHGLSQTYLAKENLDDLVTLLTKARVVDRLLEFMPPSKRSMEDFSKHFRCVCVPCGWGFVDVGGGRGGRGKVSV